MSYDILFYTQSNMERDILRYIIFTFFFTWNILYRIYIFEAKYAYFILFYPVNQIWSKDNLYEIRL